MKRFAAQLVFTNTGPPLKRAIITTDDEGKIVNVEDTGGKLIESSSVEYHNGIIIPGFVTCPGHPQSIEKLKEKGRLITISTDSFASDKMQSILDELKRLQDHLPSVTLEELIIWSTINGARVLGKDNIYGTIEPEKKPGLFLLDNLDLPGRKLLPETRVRRLI